MLAVTARSSSAAASASATRSTDRCSGLAISRRAGRAALAVAGGRARSRDRRRRPGEAVGRVQGGRRPAASCPSGDVGLLRGGGSGRYQFWETAVDAFAERAGRGRRGERLHAVLVRAPRGADPGDPRALGRLRDHGRARARSGSLLLVAFFAVAAVAGVRRLRAAADRVAEAGAGAGAARGRASRRPPSTGPGTCRPSSGSRWSPRRCSPGRRRCPAPTRAATRRRRGRSAAGAGSPAGSSSCWSPGSRSAARRCCCCPRTRSTSSRDAAARRRRRGGARRGERRDRPAAVVGRAADPAGAGLRAGAATTTRRARRSPRRSSARPTTTGCACSRRGWPSRTATPAAARAGAARRPSASTRATRGSSQAAGRAGG